MNEPRILRPDGHLADPADRRTERAAERRVEDQSYVPVIIKRTDEGKAHPDDILERAITEGGLQLKRGAVSLLLSSMAAGLILGFSVMAVAVVAAVTAGEGMEQRVAMAFAYPLGFIICIMSGTQLFTEHTATAVYPVLDRKASFFKLYRLWGLVIGGNLVGAFMSAWMISAADDVIGAKAGYVEIVPHMLHWPAPSLFLSAVLAGWLMAQGGWLVLATQPAVSQIICVYLVTFLIGIGGLHHSIAGSAEVFTAALVTDLVSWGDVMRFIPLALVGNLVGGSIFVAILNYAHIRKTQEKRAMK